MILSHRCRIGLEEIPHHVPAGDIGEEIDWSDVLLEPGDGGLDGGAVADVGRGGPCAAVAEFRRVGGAGGVDVEDADVAAFLGQADGGGAADPAGAAGQQDAAA